MPTMNIQISLKFHAVCAVSKVLQNYNDLGLKEVYIYTDSEIIVLTRWGSLKLALIISRERQSINGASLRVLDSWIERIMMLRNNC